MPLRPTNSGCTVCVSVSLAAFKRLMPAEQEEHFVAGLLHDMGKIPLNKQFAEEYYQVWESAGRKPDPFYHWEDRLLGIDHCEVGSMIAQKWHLGSSLVESLSHHHDPDDCTEKNRDLVSAVSLANLIAIELKIGTAGDRFVDKGLLVDLSAKVGVDYSKLSNFQESVGKEIDRAKIFLEIALKG